MSNQFDIVIVGGGPVGLSLAAALGGSGLKLALVEPQPMRSPAAADSWDSRVYAISPGAAAFLERCGAWDKLPRERVTRVEAMQIYGDDGEACLEFSAYDAGLRELAFIVENGWLQHTLWQRVREQDIRIYCPATWTALELGAKSALLRLDEGTGIGARLVVGADGAESRIRSAAGITVMPSEYAQLGVVANFSCERPHDGIAYQWFRRDGVLALLPLPGERVSMVWSIAETQARRLLEMDPAALGTEVVAASRGMLGALRVITPPMSFRLKLQRVTNFTKPRVALVGDAAHNVHPLAGQGVNLGFRDARELAEVLGARGPCDDCGEHALLRRYARARKEDVLAMQFTTDSLQKLFNNDVVWVARARNLGLKAVNWLPLLKTALVHRAVS